MYVSTRPDIWVTNLSVKDLAPENCALGKVQEQEPPAWYLYSSVRVHQYLSLPLTCYLCLLGTLFICRLYPLFLLLHFLYFFLFFSSRVSFLPHSYAFCPFACLLFHPFPPLPFHFQLPLPLLPLPLPRLVLLKLSPMAGHHVVDLSPSALAVPMKVT